MLNPMTEQHDVWTCENCGYRNTDAPDGVCENCEHDAKTDETDERRDGMSVYIVTAQGEYGEWHSIVDVFEDYDDAAKCRDENQGSGKIVDITARTVQKGQN